MVLFHLFFLICVFYSRLVLLYSATHDLPPSADNSQVECPFASRGNISYGIMTKPSQPFTPEKRKPCVKPVGKERICDPVDLTRAKQTRDEPTRSTTNRETSVQGQAKRDVVASDDYITMESGSGLEVWRGNTTEPGADESEIPCLINGDGEVPGECPTKDVPNNQNHSDTGDILSPEDPKTPGEENPQDYEPETTPNNPYYSVVFNVATPSKTTSESSAYYSVIQETETESSEVGPESSEVGPESSEVGPYYSVIQETETHEVEELVYHYAQVSLDNDAKKKKKRRPTSQERCLGKNLAAQTPDTLASSHANAVTATGYINMDSCGPLATEIACVNVESNPMATEHSIYKDAEQAYMNVEQSTVKATDHDPSDQDTEIADYVNVDPADFANVDTLTVMEQETVPADSGEKMSADSGETVLGDSGETVLGDSGETGPGDSGETELADYVNVDPGNITEREHAHQQD